VHENDFRCRALALDNNQEEAGSGVHEELLHRSSARRAPGLGFSSVLTAEFVCETVSRVGRLGGIACQEAGAMLFQTLRRATTFSLSSTMAEIFGTATVAIGLAATVLKIAKGIRDTIVLLSLSALIPLLATLSPGLIPCLKLERLGSSGPADFHARDDCEEQGHSTRVLAGYKVVLKVHPLAEVVSL